MIKAAVLVTALLAAQVAGAQAPASSSEPLNYDPAKADAGKKVYTQNCARCHGLNMRVSGVSFFDLRRLNPEDKPRYINSVRNGLRAMPAWGDNLTADEYELIWSYIITTNVKAAAK